jgi:hypothetical protein
MGALCLAGSVDGKGFFLRVGEELAQIAGYSGRIGFDEPNTTFTAMTGTAFNPDNPQHQIGSDGLRFAIAIQMHRDSGDYQTADAIRAGIGKAFIVECGKDRTTLKPHPDLFKGQGRMKP